MNENYKNKPKYSFNDNLTLIALKKLQLEVVVLA